MANQISGVARATLGHSLNTPLDKGTDQSQIRWTFWKPPILQRQFQILRFEKERGVNRFWGSLYVHYTHQTVVIQLWQGKHSFAFNDPFKDGVPIHFHGNCSVAQWGKREPETDRAIFPVPARAVLHRTVTHLDPSSETRACLQLAVYVILCDIWLRARELRHCSRVRKLVEWGKSQIKNQYDANSI